MDAHRCYQRLCWLLRAKTLIFIIFKMLGDALTSSYYEELLDKSTPTLTPAVVNGPQDEEIYT